VHEFSVWAPNAERVGLHLPGQHTTVEMTALPDGWWHTRVETAEHGTDYAFELDAGRPLPDPRSGWQPAGVHGPSRLFDTGLHVWHDQDWSGRDALGAVFYELHVGTFTAGGTLDSAIEHLDHLAALGVDLIELMPVAAFSGRHGWGYDGVDLYAVHEPYGGPAALQRFVDACHTRGLGVCLDVVYNHVGPDGNYLSAFGPYFTDKHDTPWGAAVNLDDAGSAGVRDWIVNNALRWFEEFHLDCLRLDAVHALVDTSGRHILAELSDEVTALSEKLGRPLGLVAESDLNDPVMIEPTASGGLGMTGQWADDLHHALHAWLTGERQGYYCDFGSTEMLARTLTQVFRHAGEHSAFRGSVWGRPVDAVRHRGQRFVVCAQNHDQVGNRATGDRLAEPLSPGRLAAAAAIVLTSPFTPLLFMGEEWAARTPWQFFTSFEDPDLGEAVRSGRRREFAAHGWHALDVPDPQDPATRRRSVLDWREPVSTLEPLHGRLLAWHRDLIALRRREPDLRDDDLRTVRLETGPAWLVMHRGSFRVLVNLEPEAREFPTDGPAEVLLGFGEVTAGPRGVSLGPDGVAVLRQSAG
jgi:maltooligosyltrehalose trehalohydrolase